MADWIKIETTTSQKIEVLTMADILDEDEDLVFGKLIKLWCWADANTVDGNAQGVTKRMIDRVTNYAGFAEALLHERVGWLIEDEDGNLSFPNFNRHNGKGAKKRAVTARRVKQHRENVTDSDPECNAESVTKEGEKALPEKRREEKNRKEVVNKNTTSKKLDYSSWPSMPSEQVMNDWLALRKRLKANVSQTVINRFANEFKKAAQYGLTVDYCLTECVAKGWRGFEADWLIKNQPRHHSGGIQQMSDAAAQTFKNLEDGF